MIRLFRASGTAALASALAVTGLTAAVAAPAHAEPSPVDMTLCEGTPVWTGDIADDQVVSIKSTVRGTAPATFSGSYVGQIKDSFGNKILLFDVAGAPVTKPDGSVNAGIWSGMSGSPVSDADGNLVGAVAYSFTGSAASTIAGVTPAADMLRLGSDDALAPSVRVPSAIAREAEVPVGTRLERMSGRRVMAGAQTGRYDFTRKASRLSTSGPLGRATLANLSVESFVPGGNIAASWTSGDMVLASVGTVTAVCGDRVFAFGHPDESSGAGSAQTIHHASTVAVLPDDAYSYKMVEIDPTPAGALLFDGNSGIVGQVGLPAKTSIPVTSSVTRGSAPVRTLTTKVSEPLALSYTVASQVYSGLATSIGNEAGAADVTTRLTIRLRGEDGKQQSLYRRVRTAATSDALAEAASDVAGAVEMLAYGVDEEIRIDSVTVATTVHATTPNGYKLSAIEYRTGKTLPAKWTKATSKIKVKKGHKLQVRYVAKKWGSPTTVVRTAAQTLSTTSKYSSTGTVEGLGASSSYWDEDEEFYFDEDELSLKDALALLKATPSNEAVRSTITYRSPSLRRTAGSLLTSPTAYVSGQISAPLSFVK